ncbi:ABC transporter permease [Zoogloea ramigera]|jgi:putative ABC transport system permease protein|uniref:ABC transporter permease n=1 Tax=Zoogloea ramigera TaxID=350 RepID=UPI00114299A7|nr:FtsX-like permease family protein [Zoogloea ramigera]
MSPQALSILSDLTMAFRNVVRHRRRAGFALLIIAGGVLAFLLSGGFIHWLLDNMREGFIHSQVGHIQVVRPNYFEVGVADPYRYLLPENSDAEKAVRSTEHVVTMSSRLSFSGLASFKDQTITFMGEGVDSEAEKQVSRDITLVAGEALSSSDPTGVLLGRGLAANLGVKVGDTLVLMTSTAKGGMNASDVHVRGLFSTFSKEYDDGALRVPVGLSRELMRVKGATTWVVLLDDTANTAKSLQALRDKLDPKQFQLVPWEELADMYIKTRDLFLRQVFIVEMLIGLIIVLSIGNTLHMAVVERTGEIGTAMALGVRRRHILRLFIFEGLVLGTIGGFVGVSLGWSLSILISWIGIPMPPPPGMEDGFDAELLVDAGLAFNAFVLAVVTTVCASILPAFNASRMNIVDALRHQR